MQPSQNIPPGYTQMPIYSQQGYPQNFYPNMYNMQNINMYQGYWPSYQTSKEMPPYQGQGTGYQQGVKNIYFFLILIEYYTKL